MDISSFLSITPLYIAISGLVFIAFTLRVGLYRRKTKVSVGDGSDPELLLRIRGHANFIETVPIALILLVAMELMGASGTWLHALGSALVLGRILHYLGLTELGPFACRPVGMILTLVTVLTSSIWVLSATL